jgi:hypothetical protein
MVFLAATLTLLLKSCFPNTNKKEIVIPKDYEKVAHTLHKRHIKKESKKVSHLGHFMKNIQSLS